MKEKKEKQIRNILVVSHGGWIRAFIRKLISNWNCQLPEGISHKKLKFCPNAGLSIVNVSINQEKQVKIRVEILHKTTYTPDKTLEKNKTETLK